MALLVRLLLIAFGYSDDANRAAATGLIMLAGMILPGNGERVVAATQAVPFCPVVPAQGLYSWTGVAAFKSALKSPLCSAGVYTEMKLPAGGWSKRCPW